MKGFTRAIGLAAVAWMFALGGPAASQENLDLGKSPAQLFASDCAICHKTTAGLSKARSGVFGGLKDFLREHYTASKEAAAAIAAYVEATDKGPPPAVKQKAAKRTSKGDEKGKKSDVKKDEKKTDEKADKKPDAEKTGEAKSDDKKPEEKKSEEKKPAETKTDKPPETKASDTKSGDKPTEKKSD
jgi:outer membrane biosynthesis protein TonB